VYKHASANRFYRLVWSAVNACWVAVAEGTRGRGKSARRRTAAAVLSGVLASGAALAAAPPELPVSALPQGGQVVAGQAQVLTNGSAMTVNQATAQAILNWQSFDIGAQSSVRFNQPSASAVALNRVLGTDPSRIYGKLSSNGKVFLVNSQGVLFGAGAQVNVGGLVASSLGISDQDFLGGNYDFSAAGTAGAVRNDGSIQAANGGYVALLGSSVTNNGSVAAAKGGVALAAGQRIGLDLHGDGLITVQVERGALAAAVQNKGIIQADGGQVVMTAGAADALARSSVNNTGLIQARGLSSDGGSIRLVADDVQAGRLDVASSAGKGGTVALSGGIVSLDGKIDASGVTGGSVAVAATESISASAATVATGRAEGGTISYRAGGSLTANDASAADASGAQRGGSVSMQAGGELLSSAQYSARGTAGNGGRIDVSGADVRLLGASLDASGASAGGLVRVGGAFQGGQERADAPDAWRYSGRWGQSAPLASAAKTFVSDSSVINVGATGPAGQGGTAVVWSNQQTTMLGSVKARGAAAGGVVEISSKDELRHVGLENLDIGAGGRLLLDPKNITIGNYPNVWTYEALLGKGYTGGKSVNQSLDAGDGFGFAVALNGTGDRLAVGAPYDDGVSNGGADRGAVRMYAFTDANFSGATLKGTIGSGYTGTGNLDVTLADGAMFGSSLALSANANVMAVGAVGEGSGTVRLFNFSGGNFSTPSQAQLIKPSDNAGMLAANTFGVAVALNAAGDKLAVGSLYDTVGAATLAGSVYLFQGTPGSSAYAGRITSPAAADYQQFGTAVALNAAGDKLAVGAIGTDNSQGAVYLYKNPFSAPTLSNTIKNGASGGNNLNVSLLDNEMFGSAVALSADGSRLVVGSSGGGAFGETNGPGNVRVIDFTDTSFTSPSISATLGRDYTVGANADVTLTDGDNFGFSAALDATGTHLVVGAPYSSSQDGIDGGAGTVHAYSLLPNTSKNLGFNDAKPKASLDATVDASKLAAALTSGVSITLQANNDITLATGNNITVMGGSAGSLTLQAGRSVALNSNITTGNGNLTVVANDTVAHGVVDANRDTGAATITVAAGKTINSGTGTVSMTIADGAGKTNLASGDITVSGTVSGNTVKLVNSGATAGSDVVIAAGGTVSSASGTVEIAAAGTGGGTFTNGGTLSANRYLVYSDTPTATSEGVTGYSKHYNQSYTGTTPAYASTGSWFLYKTAPTLTVTADSQTRTYDGTTNTPTLTYTSSGFIDGDTAAIFSGALGITSANKNAGTYAINIGTLAQSLGYGVTYNGANFDITKRTITPSASGGSKQYDGSSSATGAVLSSTGAVPGEFVFLTGVPTFSDKNVATSKQVTIAAINMSGPYASNYTLSSTTATTLADITKRPLTLTATGVNRVYDGTTNATVTLTDNRVGGDSLNVSVGSASFDDKNVGTGKSITVNSLNVSGASQGNYSYSAPTGATANITPRTLNASTAPVDKVYDGSTGATVFFSNDKLAGDVVTLTGTSTFANKNVGTSKVVTTTGIAKSGADAGNYTLASTTATGNANITARVLNLTASAAGKTYDGGTLTSATFGDDRVMGDVLTLAGTANFADKNAGTSKVVNIAGIGATGTDSGNYILAATSATASANITARTLTATATGINKVYDATNGATATYGDDRVGGDTLSISGSATFADKNVGTGKTVSVSGLALSGTDAANYTLASTTATTSANITPRTLTATAAGIDKVYDGATSATASYGDDRIAGDSLTVSGNAGFGNKNVGTGKTVSVTGLSLSGTDSGNYVLGATTATTSADITARALTASAAGIDKVYDATTGATVTLSDDRVAGDTLSLTGASATFGDKNVGTAKTVTVTGLGLAGADAGNYTLASTSAATSADITARTLTASATGINKVYDATKAATVTLGDDRIAGDTLAVAGAPATFLDKHAGTGKTVTVTGLALSGTDAGNYTLASTTAVTSADITARALNVNASGNSKVYDATVAASANLSDDRILGDTLAVTGSAAYGDKNVGTGKAVTVSGLALSGADAGNYTLATTAAATSADITARTLTVSAAGAGKVYDGTTAATVALGDDRVAGDTLTLTGGSASFGDKNVGAGKAVTVTGLGLAGADAGNYALASTTTGTAADITARTLNVSATGSGKVYDATTAATATLADDRVAGDTLSVSGNAAFGNKNVGTGKAVAVSGLALSGIDAANYTLASTTAATTADISARTLTATVIAGSKVYDATTAASVTLGDNRIAGDTLSVAAGSATFSDKNAGAGKTVTVTGLGLSGADAGNYTLASTTATASADIAARALTVSAGGINKVYDATTAATVTLADDRAAGDTLTLTGAAASFGDKNVGTARTVTVTGLGLAGADAGNYTLVSTTTTTSADIGARTLNVSATGSSKVYDATRAATVTLADDRLAGDILSVRGSAAYADQNAGTGKAVSVTGLALSGTDAGNYALASTSTATTGAITPKGLSGSVGGTTSKVYDGSSSASIAGASISLTGFVAGEGATAANVAGSYNSANVMAATTVTTSLTGADLTANGGTVLSNYTLPASIGGAGAITPKAIGITGVVANAKVYDGTTAATLAARGTLTGLIGTQALTLNAPATVAFDTRSAGTAKTVTASGYTLADGAGGLAANYALTSNTVRVGGTIDKAALVVTADNKQRVTGVANPAWTFTVDGLVDGDDRTLLAGTSGSTNATLISPSGEYAINVAGGALNDYHVTYVDGTLKVVGGGGPVDKAVGSIVSTLKDADFGKKEGEAGPHTPLVQKATGRTADLTNVANAASGNAKNGEEDEEVVVLRGGSRVKVKRSGLRAPNPQ